MHSSLVIGDLAISTQSITAFHQLQMLLLSYRCSHLLTWKMQRASMAGSKLIDIAAVGDSWLAERLHHLLSSDSMLCDF